VLLQRFQHRPPDQLLEERRGDAGAALDDLIDVGFRQLGGYGAGIELEQPPARAGVGQVDLDRDVDPAGTRRQRRFEQVGSIGREDEEQSASGAAPSIASSRSNRTGLDPRP
jgi:hypothetical protein